MKNKIAKITRKSLAATGFGLCVAVKAPLKGGAKALDFVSRPFDTGANRCKDVLDLSEVDLALLRVEQATEKLTAARARVDAARENAELAAAHAEARAAKKAEVAANKEALAAEKAAAKVDVQHMKQATELGATPVGA